MSDQRVTIAPQDSLRQASEKLVVAVADVMRHAQSEEDLRIGVEKLLEPLLHSIGVRSEPRYERLGAKTIYRGRPDAVHGQVVIEYESPRAFVSEPAIEHAHAQLVNYILAEVRAQGTETPEALKRWVGVGFDGETIFFVQYRAHTNARKTTRVQDAFVRVGPFPFDAESARTLLTFLRALSRLPLTAEHLAERFGPSGHIAPLAVSALADALENWSSARVRVFFTEWKRLFGIVYGEPLEVHHAEDAQLLGKLYRVDKETDFQELLFSIHTYFAFLMKLIAAELVTLSEAPLGLSFSHRLTHSPREDLIARLNEMENGGVYAQRGIVNFLEGDFFRWYLDALSPRLEETLREIARGLTEFEPATTAIDPEAGRDLLKKLYQYLVPQQVRHKLGEYYTPDWLGELLLDETGYDGDLSKRLLDPSCGSGTFIVLAIQRAKDFGRAHREPLIERAKKIVTNIWGFDLNPLAVIASRTNYLFALGELADKLASFEIPIYLADAVLWPQRNGQLALRPRGESVEVTTSLQPFFVPRIWIENRGFLLARAAPLVERMVKQQFSAEEALQRLKAEGLVFAPHEEVIRDFYNQMVELEQQGKDGIWARLLKNIFAPMVAGKFDFVIGNPPWVRWGYLSNEYRAATLPLWQNYGLFSLKGHAARLGGGEKDFSMLFTYAVADYYLADGGKLGFLITQEVFKSKGAGEGFRRFRLGDGVPLQVLKAHDLATVQPFEGATNKAAAIVLRKGKPTKYPVSYTVWTRKKGVGKIPTNYHLKEALPLLQRQRLLAEPIGTPTSSWQTISKAQKALNKIEGTNAYQARLGARVEPYGVFWIEIQQVLANKNLLVRNLAKEGKRRVPEVQESIEPDLVFPAVRGADIQRWRAVPKIHIVMVQNPQTSEPYPESDMKTKWPRTFSYLTRFKSILLSRGSRTVRELAQRTAFYAMFGIGPYTVARYKVVWKRMASDLVAAVVSQHKTVFGWKTIIPTDTTSLIAVDNEDEAHYLCAILNATPVREFVKSYSAAGRGFGAPSVMEHIGIPKFDAKNRVHAKLAQLSRQLHDLKAQDARDKIPRLEKQVDDTVAQLFGMELK